MTPIRRPYLNLRQRPPPSRGYTGDSRDHSTPSGTGDDDDHPLWPRFYCYLFYSSFSVVVHCWRHALRLDESFKQTRSRCYILLDWCCMLVLPDQFDSDSTTMSETTNSLWITICCSIAIQACISACYKYIDTNYGKDWRIHVAYLAVAICSVAFIPVNVASYIFTSLTVSFVGYVVMYCFVLIVIPCVM
jgi:hypothetical protein